MPIPTIIHELTHFVNFQKFNPKELYSVDDGIMDKWTYLYRDIERNARISEFGYYLNGKKKNNEIIDNNVYSEEYSDILKLNDMQEIINTIYYGNDINGFDPILSLFYSNQLVPIKDKKVTDENYFRIKNKLYQWYLSKYNEYLKKAKKLLKYYAVN